MFVCRLFPYNSIVCIVDDLNFCDTNQQTVYIHHVNCHVQNGLMSVKDSVIGNVAFHAVKEWGMPQPNVIMQLMLLSHYRGTWVTDYKVDVSLEGGTASNKTSDYVSTTSCRTQDEADQYGTVWITENVDQVILKALLRETPA